VSPDVIVTEKLVGLIDLSVVTGPIGGAAASWSACGASPLLPLPILARGWRKHRRRSGLQRLPPSRLPLLTNSRSQHLGLPLPGLCRRGGAPPNPGLLCHIFSFSLASRLDALRRMKKRGRKDRVVAIRGSVRAGWPAPPQARRPRWRRFSNGG